MNYGKRKIGKVPGPVVHQPCKNCNKPLPIDREDRPVGDGYNLVSEYTGRWQYRGYGAFCTQTCATKWANRLVKDMGLDVPLRGWQEDERP